MSKKGHIHHKKLIGSIIFYVLMAFLLYYIAVNLIVPDRTVRLAGFQLSIIPSGSMEPNIMIGDIIIMTNIDSEKVKENDIVVYYNYIDPNQDGVYTYERVVHRVISTEVVGNETRIITKGDNNSANDIIRNSSGMIEGYLTTKDVIAQVPQIGSNHWVLRIPQVGYVMLYAQWFVRFMISNPILLLLVVVNVAVIVTLIVVIVKGNKAKHVAGTKEEESRIKANDVTDETEHERDDDEEDGSA